MSARDATTFRADVVILTAIRLELDAVLDVGAGAVPGSLWEVAVGPNGLPVWFRSFVDERGLPLRVAVAVAGDMGATAAIHALMPLVDVLKPRCVAMCGVCAGRRGKTRLGDVVAADRLFFHGTGKQRPDQIQQDLTVYKLRDDWKVALEGLDPRAQFRDAAWFHRRPLTTEWREHRALIALRNCTPNPWNEVEPELGENAWNQIVKALRKRKLIAPTGQKLTEKGQQVAADLLFEHKGALPDLSPAGTFQPFRLHVAPIGSGERVIEDETIWGFISQAERKTLGIDMEATALGELAHRQRQLRLEAVVMKGVMDFANHGRDDHFKEFAARASAECLLWFLRQRIATDLRVGVDDVITSDTPSVAMSGDIRFPRAPSELIDYGIERQRHEQFIGREAVLENLNSLLIKGYTDRWVVVTGGPGVGKSAILAEWLRHREAAGATVPHHFIRREFYGWNEPTKIVRSLAAQVEARYPAQRDPEASPESRLIDLLNRVSARELVPRGDRLVLLVDGLDEYDAPTGTYDPLAAFLPHALPRNVRFLCASRPRHPYLAALEARNGELTRIDLDSPFAANSNHATVRAFWQREAAALGLGDRFIDEAVASAGGNMQHAVTLQRHLASVPPAQRRVEAIPRGLEALLTLLWRRVATSAPAARGLGILCAAREPLSLDEIGMVAGWEGIVQREAFVHAVLELLTETQRKNGVAAYQVHHDAIRAHVVKTVGLDVARGHHAALARVLATWPTPADPAARQYALRYAVAHRAEAGDWAVVGHLVGDLGFLEAKCRELGVQDIETDVARATEQCRISGDTTIVRQLGAIEHALARESHWLCEDPGALSAQLWNRLRRLGWSTEDLTQWVRLPTSGEKFVRVRKVISRESPALMRDFIGHGGPANACVVTPDGRRVISASDDETLKIWDLKTGRVVATLEGHAAGVNSCTVTPDGRHVISGSDDDTLRVWDLDTGLVVTTLEGHTGSVNSCAVTPDGQGVISASADKTLKLWNLNTGQAILTFEGHTSSVNSCAATPDGRRVVSASADHTLKLWDLLTGRIIITLEGHTDSVKSCAAIADGRRVVSASTDNTLKLWDLDTGRIVKTFEGHTNSVNGCAVTPDRRFVVSGSADKTLRLWDLDTGSIVTTFEGHTVSVNACAAIPDNRRVISASSDGLLKVWNLEIGQGFATSEGHPSGVSYCAVTPVGRHVVSASYDKTLKVWDLDTSRVVATLAGHTKRVSSCAVTPNGRFLVSASYDKALKIWDLDTDSVVATLSGHTHWVCGCAVTPDGRHVVSASWDKTLKVWDLHTGRVVTTLEAHTDGVMGCAVTPDGRHVVSASWDTTLKVWDLHTGCLVATFEGHTAGVTNCAITPDGQRVVSTSYDKTLKVWNLAKGSVFATLKGHTDKVNSCAVTPDGQRVASVSEDRTLKIWDLSTNECLATHRGDTRFTAVVATPTVICAGDAAGGLWFLDWTP